MSAALIVTIDTIPPRARAETRQNRQNRSDPSHRSIRQRSIAHRQIPPPAPADANANAACSQPPKRGEIHQSIYEPEAQASEWVSCFFPCLSRRSTPISRNKTRRFDDHDFDESTPPFHHPAARLPPPAAQTIRSSSAPSPGRPTVPRTNSRFPDQALASAPPND